MKPKEETFQVVLDALALTPCYPAFLIIADVPEVYMHQFWNCIYKHDDFYRFKIDKKKRFKLTLEVFKDIFQICPRVPGRDFDAPPSEEDTIYFLRDLDHTGVINSLNDVVIDQMHQLCRKFAALINRSLSGKTSGLDKLHLSRAQILWGMYHQKNVDYVELLWEDFTYQIDNKVYKKQEKMYCPRFTIVIIHHFLIQEKLLSWRNRIGMHTSKDDYLINTLRFVSRREASQKYGAVLPECLTSLEMKERKAYKTYLSYATGAVPPKVARKFKKASPSKKDSVPVKADEKPGNDEDDSNNEQESSDEGNEQENESEEQVSNSKQELKSKDNHQDEDEIIHTPSPTDDKYDDNLESESDDVSEGDEEMDDTTNQFDDDVDARLKEHTQTDKEIVQVTKKTEGPVASSSRSSDLASKFLNFSDIPQTDAEIVSPLDVHEVSNFAPPVIEKLIKESRDEVTLEKVSSQPHSTYEAASTLTEFELKKILIDKMEKSESYLAAPEHRDCYDSLKKYYAHDKDFFFLYDVYTLKRSRKDKDKDEDPSTGSDRGLKKRKTSKDAEPTTGPTKKDSTSGSSKGTKSQPKSSGKSVQSEEPVFEVADSDMPQGQEGNLGDNEDKPRKETTSRHDWFKKPTPPKEPTGPDWNIGKTTQEGPTQNWFMNLAASTFSGKSLKDFDELMSTPIDFSGYILNGMKIKNLTQEVLLGLAFRLLKGTSSNYAKLEYNFEECYKDLSEKLDWENPEGGDYPFDLSKPLPLIKRGKRQRVPFEFFINNDLKYLQGGISTMTYTTSTTKTKAAQYDLIGIEDMVPNIWSPVKVSYDKYAL
ncbi:hypothetical protein Tco_1250237 [Tanacetum coccineum]